MISRLRTVDHVRRIPLSRRSHVTGFQPLPTGSAEHESALERDFVILTSFADLAAVITAQPVTIFFADGTTQRRYTPDFLVRWSDGRSELVEVKYRADLHTNWRQLRPRFVAARDWARERRIGFRIATERGIRGILLENARRLLPLRNVPLDMTSVARVTEAVRSLHEPTFERIVDEIAGDRSSAIAIIWRMIARGMLRTDLSSPMRPDSLVSLP